MSFRAGVAGLALATFTACGQPPAAAPATAQCGVALGLFASDEEYDYAVLLDEIVAHGATDVSLSTPWVQPDVRSNRLRPEPGISPSTRTLTRTIQQAHARGLRVTLMPVVRLQTLGPGIWRGALAPSLPDQWFAEYTALMVQHAQIAADNGVARLVVGSELSSLEPEAARWHALLREVRVHFPGTLTYSANWDRFEAVPFWDQLDEIGVSAWFEVGDNPTVGWKGPRDRLRRFADHTQKPVWLTEVGYPARTTAAQKPWDHTGTGVVDLPLQAKLYRAFFAAFQTDPIVSGVFVWNWFGVGGHTDADYTPRGRPAASVMKHAFSLWCPGGAAVRQPSR